MEDQEKLRKSTGDGGLTEEKKASSPNIHPRSPPPSSSSSPSHEFSFTISLHPPSSSKRSSLPSFAVDLSPADDIFFHGHLLPLRILSHQSISPRASTTSVDSISLPVQAKHLPTTTAASPARHGRISASPTRGTKVRTRPKSFSLSRLTKWRRSAEREEEKKKAKFDISRLLKRYARVVRPLLFFKGEKEGKEMRRQSHSFSGNLNSRSKEWGGRRRDFSAPASLMTSPTNSGLLVAQTAKISSSNDSTMEELQSAIQAAIAHCKNSIAAKEDKCKV